MKQYEIHQLVYTKLNPEDSPFEKKDFHTAFYPLELFTRTDILVIENHIYIPNSGDFAAKQVVYFNTVKDETRLFVFDINMLPKEVDTLGRGGIFICHIFVFPRKLWQQFPSPVHLMKLFTYISRNELLNSSFIDRKTGNMLPVTLDNTVVDFVDRTIPCLNDTFEIILLLYLIETHEKESADHKFVVRGEESEIRTLFNKLISYLPNIYKSRIDRDTMYDGGRMMDYSKTFVAYK